MADGNTLPIAQKTASDEIECLGALERQARWLASWMIHHANHLRRKRDGLKVGGHLASCSSATTLMTALYFGVLRAEDRVAVKPHASPVLHAIEYIEGRQTREQLENFRAIGGAQSYPSRTKDAIDIDFSTGSVGLGVGVTVFASLVQDYLFMKGLAPEGSRPGRMIALVGDAELDEGNIYEALLEGWKHDIRNVWWIIDYNRQSLDAVVQDRLEGRITSLFESMGWQVVTLKYGKRLEAAFAEPDGQALRQWIDNCPNALYSALTYKGGAGWREALTRDIGHLPGIAALLARHDDPALAQLMTNLGGHDLEGILDAFRSIDHDRPVVFIAYTVKGYGLPIAGHKDNHAGLLSPDQMEAFKASLGIADGHEWDVFSCSPDQADRLRAFVAEAGPSRRRPYQEMPPAIAVPASLSIDVADSISTQESFGRILAELARGDGDLARAIVTTSPDVTVSTNLGGWVNRRGLFDRAQRPDVFRDLHVVSTQKWAMSPSGQHIELGIAENNLFLLLAALGLAAPLFGTRLLPVGTLYDPFIARGLDALNYACYQDARFMLVGTPSGISLAPEGGAHQSISTPLIGMGQPGLIYFEPAYADELAAIMRWGFEHMQKPDGCSVYLRLSTRALTQIKREMTAALMRDVIEGAYWVVPPGQDCQLVLAYCGVMAPEAKEAFETVREEIPGAGLLAVTSPDRLHSQWQISRLLGSPGRSHAERLFEAVPRGAALITVLDGHPAALSWMASIGGFSSRALGVDRFGQSGDIPDLYRAYGIDTGAIIEACAVALRDRAGR
ncbi:MAG TPA: transketolase [Telmatospirillum sp.]|nr:transketolase [Telmatospirillum sp.]